jgi:hypothetical protein
VTAPPRMRYTAGMPTEPERIADFEAALRALGLDPAEGRESADWWRFYPDNVSCQGGVHREDVRVLATLCEIEADADLDRLYADLEAAPPFGRARLVEQDCYIFAKAVVPFAEVDRATIERAIRDCLAAVASDAAATLRSRWRSWS